MRDMTVAIALVLASAALSAKATAAPPSEELPSVTALTQAGASDYEPMRFPQSLANKLLAALKHPGEASSGGGGSNGSDNQHWSTHLKATAPASELLPSYTEQLTAAGWAISFTHHDGPIALQGFHFTDNTGQRWHALLIIEESAQHPIDIRNLTLRLTRIHVAG